MIEVRDVKMKFGGLVALQNISFKVHQKEILGIIGPNGAGKTTLFNVLSGQHKPTSGEVFFKNINITGFKPYKNCRLGIGRTFQITKPFENMTVYDNIMVGALCNASSYSEARTRAEDAISSCGFMEKYDILAENLTLVDRKLLEVARALATQPQVLLLDEVAAGCTVGEISELISLIKSLREKRGITIIMIEHVLKALLPVVDNVLVLNFGKMIALGKANEVMQNKSVVEAYLGGETVCHN